MTESYPPSRSRPGWLPAALVGVVVVALLGGAYVAGRMVAGDGDDAARGGTQPWRGETRPVDGVVVETGCVLPPSQDAAGRRVGYEPLNAVDGDYTTAWRCPGDGRGVILRISLGREVRLAEVGLVPGYAKTDPQSGVDRYAENNRITRVRWVFGSGRALVQRVDAAVDDPGLRTQRIPPVTTDSVTLELLESTPGPRNTVAISELLVAEAVGAAQG